MKRNVFSLEKVIDRQAALVTWQETLRQVVFDAVKESDVKEIVEGLVKRAKQGDAQATKMIFDYVLGGRGATTIRDSNVVITAESPPKRPTKARGGSSEKLSVMADRARNGEALFHDDDE